MKSAQQILDQVTMQLLMQNRKAVGPGNFGSTACVYRAANGDKCAAGGLIEDQYYHADFEGMRIPSPFKGMEMESRYFRFVQAFTLSGVDLADKQIYDLVCHLQRVHDTAEPSEWYLLLRQVATHFNLNCNFHTSQ